MGGHPNEKLWGCVCSPLQPPPPPVYRSALMGSFPETTFLFRCFFFLGGGAGPTNWAKTQLSLLKKCLIWGAVSHWAATVGDKLRTAFAREFPKCLETFAGVLNFLAWVAGYRSRVAGILNMFKKFARQIFSQNSHRVVAGVSNPSQFSFRESESARNVRQLCKGLATYATKLWLIGDKNENLTFRARDGRETGANCPGTPGSATKLRMN